MSSVISLQRGQAAHAQMLVARLQPEYAWLEAPGVRPRLDFIDKLPDWCNIQYWTEGRLFGKWGEYRWRYRPDTYGLHLVVIADDITLHLGEYETLVPLTAQPESLLLWGEWLNPAGEPIALSFPDPVFYAPEIPKPQAYPLPQSATALTGHVPCLQVQRYRHPERGEFERCVGFGYQRKQEPR